MTSRQDDQPLDRWADWLLRGRQQGMNPRLARRLAGRLRRVRDRVVRGAQPRAGHYVLDVGAGTGLLATEAARRVGRAGCVVALDVSGDALRSLQRDGSSDEADAPVQLVAGDALHLPFRDGRFDAVLTRSVLIYVVDKSTAVRELYRVLRPGGRASIYEPINRAFRAMTQTDDLDLSPVQPAHDRILAYVREQWEHEEAMLGFDERDLERYFEDAGFTSVHLTYEYRRDRSQRRPDEVSSTLTVRPNPTMPGYAEGAEAVLGGNAEEHIAQLARLLLARPLATVTAEAFLTARRS